MNVRTSRGRKTIPRRKPYAEFAAKLEHAVLVAEQAIAERKIERDKLDDARNQALVLEARVNQLEQHNKELLRFASYLSKGNDVVIGVLEHSEPRLRLMGESVLAHEVDRG